MEQAASAIAASRWSLTNNQRKRGLGLCCLYLRKVKGFKWKHMRRQDVSQVGTDAADQAAASSGAVDVSQPKAVVLLIEQAAKAIADQQSGRVAGRRHVACICLRLASCKTTWPLPRRGCGQSVAHGDAYCSTR